MHGFKWRLDTPLESIPGWLIYVAPWENSNMFAMSFLGLDGSVLSNIAAPKKSMARNSIKEEPEPFRMRFSGEVSYRPIVTFEDPRGSGYRMWFLFSSIVPEAGYWLSLQRLSCVTESPLSSSKLSKLSAKYVMQPANAES